ncbi:hypothetical protein CEC48_04075 [Pseudomonas sp. K2I15]|nr:hypothetical protein CEC48_04075 [Pseudomonas sp. K2I15]
MANNQRTYEWVNGRVHEVVPPRHWRDIGPAGKLEPLIAAKRKHGLGIQTALLVFTFSSVTLVFAGGALAVVLFVLYSVLFG